MKKFLLIFLFITSYGFAQNSGITYQAVIYNPNGEELPGVNNPYAALTEQSVCLQFGIVDASGTIEYQENIQVTTDVFGMVNLLIGTYPQTSGYAASFSDINWGADAKFLKVDIDINGDCTNFKELSNQPFTYVPFAYYSPASDTPGPAGEDGNGIVNTINNTDNTITFEYTDGTSFTTDSLTGEDGGSGLSAYEVWIGLGNTGTEQEFIDSLIGEDGGSGLSAYEVWIGLGNTGTEQEFIDSLTGPDGGSGLSAYEIWIGLGNTGTEQEFIDSLTGPRGSDGISSNDCRNINILFGPQNFSINTALFEQEINSSNSSHLRLSFTLRLNNGTTRGLSRDISIICSDNLNNPIEAFYNVVRSTQNIYRSDFTGGDFLIEDLSMNGVEFSSEVSAGDDQYISVGFIVDIYGENINKIKVSSLSENFFDRHFAEIKQFKLINFSCN